MPIQRRGMRALQIWCARVTADYPNVNIVDLTTSFRDGLAFCAIIHHFRPDLMPNFHDLKAENVLDNNALAYKVAEEELDLPSLLDPQDMVECEDPDKFSVVTYVSQFYHLFKDADSSRSSPTASPTVSTSIESENDSLLQSSSSENTPIGTPKTEKRGKHQPPRVMVFNQAELIAKYGEEIFSKSSPEKKFEETDKEKGCVTPRSKSSVGAICNGLVRARISSAEERKS